ncbi:ARGOS-like protein [Actinidia rufa]|uniref:ARGOS-like protein n=1 Tax=Actinidia rufa TaxID=165716 RepID=A0A7J0GIJ2_9ERIC|nr:ARGOS-like protein [Actinidia rufa]
MDVRTKTLRKMNPTPLVQGKKVEYGRSYVQGQSRRMFSPRSSYFSVQSLLVLVCLAVSLLILPLILPPLPPPPLMLLLLPIGILAVLMILAFMPSNLRDITNAYM